MTSQEQQQEFKQLVEKMRVVMSAKGDDYAHEDRLSNFKLAGNIVGITSHQNILSLIATKVARLGVLLKGKSPKNESVEDSFLDLSLYSLLAWMLWREANKNVDLSTKALSKSKILKVAKPLNQALKKSLERPDCFKQEFF